MKYICTALFVCKANPNKSYHCLVGGKFDDENINEDILKQKFFMHLQNEFREKHLYITYEYWHIHMIIKTEHQLFKGEE